MLHHHLYLLLEGAVISLLEGCENGESSARVVLQSSCHHIVGTATSHFFSTHGGIGASDARKEQTEIFVDFGASAHSGTWVATGYFLFDGDGRWQAFDVVHLRLVHSAQELSGISRETLYITTLTFGIQCVEGQR